MLSCLCCVHYHRTVAFDTIQGRDKAVYVVHASIVEFCYCNLLATQNMLSDLGARSASHTHHAEECTPQVSEFHSVTH